MERRDIARSSIVLKSSKVVTAKLIGQKKLIGNYLAGTGSVRLLSRYDSTLKAATFSA